MRTPKTRIHPETGKTLHRGKRELTVSYRGLTRTVVVAGWFPEDGSDGVMWRGDGDAADAALAELKAEHAALARALADRVARKLAKASARKMTRKTLSLLLTGAPNSLAKYGRGDAAPSHPTLVLMSLLDKHPELLAEIQALADPVAA